MANSYSNKKINFVSIISVTGVIGILIIAIAVSLVSTSTSSHGSQTTKAAGTAPATTLGFSPDNIIIDSTALYGKSSIVINPGSNTLTSGTVSITYDPAYLNVETIKPNYSTVFQLSDPPVIDNVKGTATIKYSATIPQSVVTPTTIGSVLFRLVKPMYIQNKVVYNATTFLTAKDVAYNALIGSTPLTVASIANAPSPTFIPLPTVTKPTPTPNMPSPTPLRPSPTPLKPSPTLSSIKPSSTPTVSASAIPDSTLEFAPSNVLTSVGSSFTETVVVKTNSNQLTSIQQVVTFNPNYLEVTSVTPLIKNVYNSAPVIDNVSGKVLYTSNPSSVTAPITGMANLMNITFRVKALTQSDTINFSGESFASGINGGAMNLLIGSTPAKYTTGPMYPTPTK